MSPTSTQPQADERTVAPPHSHASSAPTDPVSEVESGPLPGGPRRPYNRPVESGVLARIKELVNWCADDMETLRHFRPDALPFLDTVVQRFYERLLQDPDARAAFPGGAAQVEMQRALLAGWLSDLFLPPYDETYFQKRLAIGTTHVRVGLPQHYMCLGIELVWQELSRLVREASVPDVEAKLRSLHKLLTLDLCIMLSSYKAAYSEQIRVVERSAVEERLTRAEHLAEIGQLAASLAHEIKNPLAGISGAIQIIRDDMHRDDPHLPILGEVLAQIHRLDAAVKDLLLYARPTPPKATDVNVGEVVKRVLTVLAQEPALQRVRVDVDPHLSDIRLHADGGQFEQLMINLLINAAHASYENGIIRVNGSNTGDGARVVVQDAGRGMTPEILRRAFEPFYTTKARGTGLGLSICKRIVETNGGAIHLESSIGAGTKVTMEFIRRRNPNQQSMLP